MEIEREIRLFESFGLSRGLLKGIEKKGWQVPSPIQEATLESALKSKYCFETCLDFCFRSRHFGSCKE